MPNLSSIEYFFPNIQPRCAQLHSPTPNSSASLQADGCQGWEEPQQLQARKRQWKNVPVMLLASDSVSLTLTSPQGIWREGRTMPASPSKEFTTCPSLWEADEKTNISFIWRFHTRSSPGSFCHEHTEDAGVRSAYCGSWVNSGVFVGLQQSHVSQTFCPCCLATSAQSTWQGTSGESSRYGHSHWFEANSSKLVIFHRNCRC